MYSIFLHIGEPKTGTSALQLFLLENRMKLFKKGLEYPIHNIDENSISSGNGSEICGFLNKGEFKNAKRHVETLFHRIDANKTVIFSSELFSFYPKEISTIFPNAFIIIYVRRDDERIMSEYSQLVKRHDLSLPFSKWLYTKKTEGFLKNVYERIAVWSDLFGKNKIIVRPYEKTQFVGGSIFSDFLNIFNIKTDSNFIFPNRQINKSYHREVLEFKRWFNSVSTSSIILDKTLQAYSDKSDIKNPWIYPLASPLEVNQLYEENKIYYYKVAKEYLGKPDGVMFLSKPPRINKIWYDFPGLTIKQWINIFLYIMKNDLQSTKVILKDILKSIFNRILSK